MTLNRLSDKKPGIDRVVETMKFNSFRKVSMDMIGLKRQCHLTVSDKKHGMIILVEKIIFNSFRQEAWNDMLVETMTFSSFRQEILE